MATRLLKSVAVCGFSVLAFSALANPLLPVVNLTFTQINGDAPKASFSAANPVGWTGGQGLIAIAAPGTASDTNSATHPYGDPLFYYGVYGPFPNPPPGGNFIQADGNPGFQTAFNQVLTGLVVNQTYDLSFWQAAGQQIGFTGATTEQWIVGLGGTGFNVFHHCGAVDPSDPSTNLSTYSNPGAEIHTTLVMNTPSQGISAWNQVTMSFTATAVSETLSFLAWGNNGSEVNLPPTVFLAGVNTPSQTPEPGTLALFALALVGFGASMRRGKSKHTA